MKKFSTFIPNGTFSFEDDIETKRIAYPKEHTDSRRANSVNFVVDKSTSRDYKNQLQLSKMSRSPSFGFPYENAQNTDKKPIVTRSNTA